MASEVDSTRPGSKNDWRVTYLTKSQKWTNDRPGDGIGESSGELLKDTMSEPAVKRGLKAIEKAIEGGSGLKGAVDGMIRDTGTEKGKVVLNAVYKDAKKSGASDKQVNGWNKARKMVTGEKEVNEIAAGILKIAKELISEKTYAHFDEASMGKKSGKLSWLLKETASGDGLWNGDTDWKKVLSEAKKESRSKDADDLSKRLNQLLEQNKNKGPKGTKAVIMTEWNSDKQEWGRNQRTIINVYYVDEKGVSKALKLKIAHAGGESKVRGATTFFVRKTREEMEVQEESLINTMDKAVAKRIGLPAEEYAKARAHAESQNWPVEKFNKYLMSLGAQRGVV